MLLYQKELVEMFPQAKWVVIVRDIYDAEESFASACEREGLVLGESFDLWQRIKTAFDKFSPPGAVWVNFELLQNQTMIEHLWNHCLPDVKWNQQRYELLRDLRVEPVLERKYKEFQTWPRSLQL